MLSEILAEDSLLRVLLDNVYDGVYFTDTQRRILYWNASAERITGYTRSEVTGHSCADNILVHVTEDGESLCWGKCPLAACLEDKQPRQARVFLHHKQGHRVPIFVSVAPIIKPDGELFGALETFRDMTPELALLKEAESLREMALICPLTGVGNRRFAEQTLKKRMDEANREHTSLGFLMLDIDHFKSVNDRYGHEVGDLVLKTVARTLSNALRSYDFLGRWGGEEFVTILPNVTIDSLTKIAERLLFLVASSTLQVSNNQLMITISIGGTLYRHGESREELVNRADMLLYSSKREGRNRATIK